MTLFVTSLEGDTTVTATGMSGSTLPCIILSSTIISCCVNCFSLITIVPLLVSVTHS